MSLIIDVSDSIKPFLSVERANGRDNASIERSLLQSIGETLSNVADIFEGLDEGISPDEIPSIVSDGYFKVSSYNVEHSDMDSDTLLEAELFVTLLEEISFHRPPDTSPVRKVELVGEQYLIIDFKPCSDAGALEEWEACHVEDQTEDPNAPVQLSFDFNSGIDSRTQLPSIAF